MFELQVKTDRIIRMNDGEILTSGSLNTHFVHFDFSPEWDGLIKTAVFTAGDRYVAVAIPDDNTCVIPSRVMMEPNDYLKCGVYGRSDTGAIVRPTITCILRLITPGTVLEGAENNYPPEPELWQQEISLKGDGIDYDGTMLRLLSGDRVLSKVETNFAVTMDDVNNAINAAINGAMKEAY